jgi:hypothetical protein
VKPPAMIGQTVVKSLTNMVESLPVGAAVFV